MFIKRFKRKLDPNRNSKDYAARTRSSSDADMLRSRKGSDINQERASGPAGQTDKSHFGNSMPIDHSSRGSNINDEKVMKPKKHSLAIAMSVARMSKRKDRLHRMAEGGMAEEDHPASVAEAIMRKSQLEHDDDDIANDMADLDNNNAEVMDDNLDDMNKLAKENDVYSVDEQYDGQPEDSNQHDVELDSDEHDMVEAIRRRMKQHGKTMLK